MDDKVLLIQKFRNDSFMAVLKDGYTFNDSMVVEAKDKAELDAKIAAAVHCDDRWITWNGRPVLIKGSGQFATGPLKGQYISKGRKMARGKRKGWNNKKAGRYSPNKEQNGSGDSNVKSGTAAAKDNKIKKYSPAAQRMYDKARKAEPAITKDLVDISKSLGMKMEGLDYSVKTGSSTDSKIGRKRKNKQTDTDYVKSMGDLVRYTQMGKHEDLGTNTVKTIKALEENGYKITKVDNKYLDKNSDYKGIHLDVVAPSGQKFELQIHSAESMAVKNKIHPMYEKYREMKDGPEKEALSKQMKEISATLPMPKGIENVKNYETS